MAHLKADHASWFGDEQQNHCDICQKTFANKQTLKKHKQKIHEVNFTTHGNIICSECEEGFKTRKEILFHIENSHETAIKTEKIYIERNEDFEQWKSEVERNTSSKFIKLSTTTLSSGQKCITFKCHRAGKPKVAVSTGKRHPKMGGSNKTGYFCTAYIEVKSTTCKELFPAEINYCLHHFGHDCDVGHLPLSRDEKNKIAGQIMAGMSAQNVLCNIAETSSPSERIASIRMQDISNISTSYGLKSHEIRHKDDFISVDLWTRDIKETGFIVLYKPKGEKQDRFTELDEGDFLLGYMSEAQAEILKTFGSNVICIDSTHGTNYHNMH